MVKNILILGAGFGGLEASTSLREKLDDSFNITLIDKNEFITKPETVVFIPENLQAGLIKLFL